MLNTICTFRESSVRASIRMRRSKRIVYAQFAVFASVLCLVLFLNLAPTSSTRHFAWSKIHYQTRSRVTPERRGICPYLTSTKYPALVVARVKDDGDNSWLANLADKYHVCEYNADRALDRNSATLQVPENRGHEAMVYLTFIIDNYNDIPEAGVVFVHGNRFQWHNDAPDYDNLDLLASLNITAALQPYGYHNLRCDWSASTCSSNDAPPQGSLETTFKAKLQPWDARAVSDAALPSALGVLFGERGAKAGAATLLGRSDTIRAQCCAQFAVSRERIWQHSREEYIALRQWLLEDAPSDDRVAGRILSYVWHILFMATQTLAGDIDLDLLNAQACPSAQDCYCQLYGRCDLQCTQPGRCLGQYTVPPGYRVPENWENRHAGLV